MSGLAAVLAGRHDAGVHRGTPPSMSRTSSTRSSTQAGSSGTSTASRWRARRRCSARSATALSFPDHYGGNLDALRDCLRDLSTPTVLLWEGWGSLARAEPNAFEKVCRVLGKRADGDPSLEVLLRGPGPDDTGITSLD